MGLKKVKKSYDRTTVIATGKGSGGGIKANLGSDRARKGISTVPTAPTLGDDVYPVRELGPTMQRLLDEIAVDQANRYQLPSDPEQTTEQPTLSDQLEEDVLTAQVAVDTAVTAQDDLRDVPADARDDAWHAAWKEQGDRVSKARGEHAALHRRLHELRNEPVPYPAMHDDDHYDFAPEAFQNGVDQATAWQERNTKNQIVNQLRAKLGATWNPQAGTWDIHLDQDNVVQLENLPGPQHPATP
jgi:hypothetical protein